MRALSSKRQIGYRVAACLLLAIAMVGPESSAQVSKQLAKASDSPPTVPEPQDPLGRTTPRGTVLGFLTAAYAQNYETAAQYLNTRSKGHDAAVQAQELFFVLDRRLPAKLNNVSNDPQGSLSDPLDARRELVGSVASSSGNVGIYVERTEQDGTAVWLFSRDTLASIPDVYEEVNAIAVDNVLPEALLVRYFGFSLFGWLFFLLLIPLLYLVLSLLSRLIGAAIDYALQRLRKRQDEERLQLLPHPVRLLIVAGTIRWTFSRISLSLLARQIGSIIATVIALVGVVWLVILLNGRCEAYIRRRMEKRGRLASTAILRPIRRMVDILVAVAGLMFALHTFGVDPTAALAGLGVGGIAIALAAQKTLENVIGGASIILDEAVRVGDFFKVGEVSGTVEEVGLRSTKVRTLERTLVTIPNGQMANMVLENYASRDSFRLRHVIGIRYETASFSLQTTLHSIRTMLEQDERVLPASVRVRFLRFAESALEIEVFAYVRAREWNHFLEIQEEMLFRIRELISSEGLQIAFPSRTIYVDHDAERTAELQTTKRAMAGDD